MTWARSRKKTSRNFSKSPQDFEGKKPYLWHHFIAVFSTTWYCKCFLTMQQIFKHFTKWISFQLRPTRSIGFIETRHNKNRGQNSIALLLAGNIARHDKEGAALLRFDKVIWWRQMVESVASLVSRITLKSFFFQGMDYELWEQSLETVTHWTDLEPPHMGRSLLSLASDPLRCWESLRLSSLHHTIVLSLKEKENWMLNGFTQMCRILICSSLTEKVCLTETCNYFTRWLICKNLYLLFDTF